MSYFSNPQQRFTCKSLRLEDVLEELADQIPIFKVELVVVAYFAFAIGFRVFLDDIALFQPLCEREAQN
jgi:hypothetical protein